MKLRPTRGLIGYGAVLVLSLAPAALSSGVFGYLPCLTILFCGLLSLAYLLLVKNRLDCKAQAGQSLLVRGAECPFQVTLRNRSPLPVPFLRVQFFVSGGSGYDGHVYPLDLTLSPREERTFSLDASFPHIGVYQAGVRRLIVSDLLGILRAASPGQDSFLLNIQPRLLPVDRLPISSQQNTESDRARTASPLSGMDYVGVREYAYGDPIKTIQWKLSAHANTLMTKQMESYTNTGVSILINFDVPAYSQETALDLLDSAIETGTAVGHWAACSGLDYLLILPGDDGQPRRCTPSSFRDLQGFLPCMGLRPGSSDRLARVLREQCGSTHSQSNIVLCTAQLNKALIDALQFLKQRHKNPVLYFLMPDTVNEARRKEFMTLLAQARYAGIPCQVGRRAEEVLA